MAQAAAAAPPVEDTPPRLPLLPVRRSLRPLSKRQLAYAAQDVDVLPPLWDQLQMQGRPF